MNQSTPGIGGLVLVVITMLAASFAVAGEFHETFTSTTYRDAAASTTEWSTGAGEIRLFPYQGVLRGVVPTAASHRDVAVDGHLIYAADFSNGMVVYSRNGTEAPVQVGQFSATGSAYAVACDGRHAYLGMGTDGLRILDVSDPAAIVEVGFIDPPGIIYDIAVDGQQVYLASYNGGVHSIDVSNPSAPVLRGSYTGVTAAYGVDVDGDRVYVSSYLQDVKILDVTNPASIVELGAYNTIGHNYGVCVDGDRLYVADGAGGLLVLDVLDPSAPTLLGSTSTGGSTRSVAVAGDWIVAADYNTGLALVDAYDPTSMNSRFCFERILRGSCRCRRRLGLCGGNDWRFVHVRRGEPGTPGSQWAATLPPSVGVGWISSETCSGWPASSTASLDSTSPIRKTPPGWASTGCRE